jgi:hypothetical protein
MNDTTEFAGRVQGRLERLDLSPEDASRAAGLPADFLGRLLDGTATAPRGHRLVKLADILATSVSYLVGLDPTAVQRSVTAIIFSRRSTPANAAR